MFACAVSRDVVKPSESTIAERMKSRRVTKAQAQKRWQIDTKATMALKGIKSSRAKRKLMDHANEFSIIAKQAARAAERQSSIVVWKVETRGQREGLSDCIQNNHVDSLAGIHPNS